MAKRAVQPEPSKDVIIAELLAALQAVTMLSGCQICFRTMNGVPMMGMSRRQERLVKAAIRATQMGMISPSARRCADQ